MAAASRASRPGVGGIFDGWTAKTSRSRRNVWRQDGELGETQHRISFRKGGDRDPADKLPAGDYLQYGGVANQYFASLIVADDQQPPAGRCWLPTGGLLSQPAFRRVRQWFAPARRNRKLQAT